MHLFSPGLSRGFWLGLGVELFELPDFNECGLEETLALKTIRFLDGERGADQEAETGSRSNRGDDPRPFAPFNFVGWLGFSRAWPFAKLRP